MRPTQTKTKTHVRTAMVALAVLSAFTGALAAITVSELRLSQQQPALERLTWPADELPALELIRQQVAALKQQGSEEVAFRVAMKDGKIAFTARALRGIVQSDE